MRVSNPPAPKREKSIAATAEGTEDRTLEHRPSDRLRISLCSFRRYGNGLDRSAMEAASRRHVSASLVLNRTSSADPQMPRRHRARRPAWRRGHARKQFGGWRGTQADIPTISEATEAQNRSPDGLSSPVRLKTHSQTRRQYRGRLIGAQTGAGPQRPPQSFGVGLARRARPLRHDTMWSAHTGQPFRPHHPPNPRRITTPAELRFCAAMCEQALGPKCTVTRFEINIVICSHGNSLKQHS